MPPSAGELNGNFKGWASRNKRAYVDLFRAKFPEKAAAHDAVKVALASGKLRRPPVCERCGQPSREPLHAHHTDYLRPLDVTFLCRPCHRALHSQSRQFSQPTEQAQPSTNSAI